MDTRFWVIVACMLIELAASLWAADVRRPVSRSGFNLARRAWSSARAQSTESWLCVGLSGILLLVEPLPSFRWALSGAGILLFTLGLFIRHLAEWQNHVLRRRMQRRQLAWIPDWPRIEAVIGSRHPELVGLAIEAAGLLLVVGRWELVPFSIATLGMAIVIKAVFVDATKYPSAGLRSRDDQLGERILPSLWACAVIALATVAGFLLAGIVSREVVVFYGDRSAATSFAATLTQVVGTVVVLAITMGPVLAQLAASEMSVRSSLSLVRHLHFRVTVIVSLVVLAFDFYVLARSGGVNNGAPESWDLADYALVASAAALATIALFAWRIPRLMRVGSIVENELRAFDGKWVRRIIDEWHDGSEPRQLPMANDPLESIQRILYSAVQRRDYPTVQTTVELLERRIDVHFRRGDELIEVHESGVIQKQERGSRSHSAELDAYLNYHLWPIVALAVELKDRLTLAVLMNLWIHISPAETSVQLRMLKKSYRFFGDPVVVPGESLIRTIVIRTARAGSNLVVAEAVAHLLRSLPPLIRCLPRSEDTMYLRYGWPLEQNLDSSSDENIDESQVLSDEERRENEKAIDRVFDDYIEFLEEIGQSILVHESDTTYFHVSYALIRFADLFFDERDDRILRSEALSRSIRSIVNLVDYANELHRSGRKDMSSNNFPALTGLDSMVEKLDSLSDASLFKRIAEDIIYMVESQWRSRTLQYSLVHDAGMIFHRSAPGFIEERCAFIDVLARLAREVAYQLNPAG